MKNIIKNLDKVRELLQGGEMSEIERDIALQMLRDAYSELKFGQQKSAPAKIEAVKPAVVEKIAEPEDLAAEQNALIDLIYDKTEDVSCGIKAEEQPPVAQPEMPAPEVIENKPDAQVVEDVEPEALAVEEEKSADLARTLFAEQPIQTREIQDERRVILSLYGDSDDTVGKPTKVLGESFGAEKQTLGDAMTGGHNDLATKISTQTTTSLRSAIWLNDRFLLIRDLFGGNADQYEQAINDFEKFDNLDDALIYISENFSWNPDGEGAQLMVELLTRKLS